jgi:hypothetical protein
MPALLDSLLRLVVVTPDMHRIHHSEEAGEDQSNYGGTFPWWDRMFGTYVDQTRQGARRHRLRRGKGSTAESITTLPWMLAQPFLHEQRQDVAVGANPGTLSLANVQPHARHATIGRTKHFSRPPSAGYHRENSRRCRDEIGEAHRSRVPKRSNSRIVVDPTIVRAQLYNAVVIEGAPTEPASTPVDDISQLLRAWSDGDQLALDELTPIVYAELRRLAHRYMRRERPGHDLQTQRVGQ